MWEVLLDEKASAFGRAKREMMDAIDQHRQKSNRIH